MTQPGATEPQFSTEVGVSANDAQQQAQFSEAQSIRAEQETHDAQARAEDSAGDRQLLDDQSALELAEQAEAQRLAAEQARPSDGQLA